MNLSLLKKAAIQSVTLMITVVTASYAVNQYQSVTIKASNTITVSDTSNPSNPDVTDIEISQENDSLVKYPNEELSELNKLQNLINPDILKQLGEKYLVIKKPQGNQMTLQLEDLYVKKSIKLTLTGITNSYISSNMISRVSGKDIFSGDPKYTQTTSNVVDEEDGTTEEVITKDFGNDLSHGITITTEQNKADKNFTAQLLIELDSVYAYFIYEDENYFFIDMKKPSEVYDKILVIDAGHGGKDAGALSKGENYYEKNINLDILLQLKELLDKEDIKVYYTRTGDDTVFLRPRVELANAVDCDYFISIHCNANVVTSPNGTEILYYDNEFKGVRAFDLANLFSEELSETISLKPRGIVEKHVDDIFIMDNAVVPMVLIEVGYLTNNNDMNYLSQSKNRKDVAQGIFNGIMRAYQELPVTE
jgi:N-acetylmuramoyl-L-alanine amidase